MGPARTTLTSKDAKDEVKGARSSSRNKEGKDKKDEVWTCKLCSSKFNEDEAQLLECEVCEGHMCRNCLDLTSDQYKFVGGRTDFTGIAHHANQKP